MDILIGILTVVEVLVCLLMILIVLMQRPRQEGLGASFGDGAMTQLVGAQTTNVLQKGTVYLAVLLFVLTISLAMLTTKRHAGNVGKKVFSEPPAPVAPATPPPAPAVEVKPADATKSAVVPAMKEPVDVKTVPAPAPTSKPAEAPKSPAPAAAKPAPAVEAVKAPAPVVPPAPVAAPKP
ncbi:MAG: preprotein translocase subunit SecG [Prosthecobacter sp.]